MVFCSFASKAKNTSSTRFYRPPRKCGKSEKFEWALTFNEDDFVVFLGLSNWNLTLWDNFLWLWWWNVHVDVLLHNGCTASTRWVSTETATAASTCIDIGIKKKSSFTKAWNFSDFRLNFHSSPFRLLVRWQLRFFSSAFDLIYSRP